MADDEKQIKDDYEFSRATYYNLIDKGQEGLEEMMEVARQSEHPRAYEVLASMLKNIADINGALMDLNKKRKDIQRDEKPALPNNTTNNNVFVGSTTELQRMLMKATEDENVIDVESEK